MKIKISDMMDCSTEILTPEYTEEKCDTGKIRKIVFERIGIRKRNRWKGCAVAGIAICILCACVGAGILLHPGGKVDNCELLESEIGLLEEGNPVQGDFGTDLIEERYLYDRQGNPIAKYIIEVATEFETDEVYMDNGAMLIFHINGKGIELDKEGEITVQIQQKDVNGNPGTVEVGYILNGKPYFIEQSSSYDTMVTIRGKEGNIYPYLKNISSDREIINIKYERE